MELFTRRKDAKNNLKRKIAPMLIEAVCRYKSKEKFSDDSAISKVFISPLHSPNYRNEYLFTSEGCIQEFEGMIDGDKMRVLLKYCLASQEMDSPYKRFIFSRADSNETAENGHFIILPDGCYKFDSCSSALKTLEVSLTEGTFEAVMCANFLKLESIISLLEELQEKIEIKDGIYNLLGDEVIYSKYKLKCDVGDVCITPGVLEFLEAQGTFERTSVSETSQTMLTKFDDLAPPSTFTALYKTEFEHSNSPDYILLIKSLIEEIEPSKHTYISHFYLNNQSPLFFTMLAAGDSAETATLTIFITRELFNLIILFNRTCKNFISFKDLLNVEYIANSDISVSEKSKELLFRYRLDEFDIRALVSFAYSERRIILDDCPEAFWVFMYALECMKPLLWPGLVIMPVRKSMLYLLDGPYAFVASGSPEVASELHRLGKCDQFYIADITRNNEGTAEIPVLGSSAQLHLFSLQTRKLQRAYSFPLRFDLSGLEHVEKTYLQMPPAKVCRYAYDLSKGIVFLPRVHIDDENPVALWILISPLELDYEALIRHDFGLIPFLIKRACIDKDSENLLQLVEKARASGNDFLNTALQSVCNYRRSDKYSRIYDSIPEEMVIISVCLCSGSKTLEDDASRVFRIHPKCEVRIFYCAKAPCRKYTIVFAEGMEFSLISIENLVSLYDADYLTPQVRLSILAYFYYFNLPITEVPMPFTAECHFTIDEPMHSPNFVSP